jgi:cytochrome o ubiquinol oxidase subunit IV
MGSNGMSNPTHNTAGDLKAYVTGFILSLIFTFLPYYMVVNQNVSGTALLATIIGFAFLQMAIQIFFFLHLGRGPKPLYNVVFFFSTLGIILVVVGGSLFIMSHLHYNMTPAEVTKKLAQDEAIYQVGGEKTGACYGQHASHKVTIKNSQVSPLHTAASKCDTLTFINEDEAAREITFGTHPEHQAYGGEIELVIQKGRGKTITLSESGTYLFHDHLEPEITGDFTVQP